jgi:hypothetical protein
MVRRCSVIEIMCVLAILAAGLAAAFCVLALCYVTIWERCPFGGERVWRCKCAVCSYG